MLDVKHQILVPRFDALQEDKANLLTQFKASEEPYAAAVGESTQAQLELQAKHCKITSIDGTMVAGLWVLDCILIYLY